MAHTDKIISTQRFILKTVVSTFTITLVIMFAIFTYRSYVQNNQFTENNARSWANKIVNISIPYLKDNKNYGQIELKTKLKQLIHSSFIDYVHVYRIKNINDIDFYTSYKKDKSLPTISDKLSTIKELPKLHYTSKYLELVVEIKVNQQLYGYIYIQSNLKYRDDFLYDNIFIATVLIFISLFVSTFIAFIIYNKLNHQLLSLSSIIQKIIHHKEYSQRVSPLVFKEFDILGKNINFLLDKMENHLIKQQNIQKQLKKTNDELKNKVGLRTDALKDSNHELLSTLEKLHQFQNQLVEKEKMASLGDMVAGVAHEINTPIGLGVTASTLLSDRITTIKQDFENKTLKSSQLKHFLIDGQENISIIYRNLDRAANLILNFKKLAVNQSDTEIHTFNIKNLIDEVLFTLKAKIEQKNILVTFSCPEDLIIESKPEPISQILINLIFNTIIHGFENLDTGIIKINIINLSGQLHINYQDNGVGIDEDIKLKIFEPFTTTKRGTGGSGLGLHLVYNLVTQALNGHISFESEVNHGVSFDIAFPIEAHTKNE